MRIEDCLSNYDNYERLIDLLYEGTKIRLYDGMFTIKHNTQSKDKEDLIVEETGFSGRAINSFLVNANNLGTIRFVNDLKNILESTVYIKDKEHDLFVKHEKNYQKKDKITRTDILTEEYLKLIVYPFYRSCKNKYLQYVLPGIEEYIKSQHYSNPVYLLLFRCENCGHIYDVVDFLDIENMSICHDCYRFNKNNIKDKLKNIIENKYLITINGMQDLYI
jgi:hypothetical protein